MRTPPEDTPFDRRRFFRFGLRELLKPLAGAVEPIERAAEQLAAMDTSGPLPAAPTGEVAPLNPYDTPEAEQFWLRPPGSVPEQDFRDICSRCGECVSVCPAQCIKIDHSGAKGHGVPYIEPDVMPCVVCDSLACTDHCPSGAILPLGRDDIDMGTAIWDEHTCLRSNGEQCQICVDQCPYGAEAIRVDGQLIHVIEEGCTGCGVCQHYCPTNPKSIVVQPVSARPEIPSD
jgi:MauM/NapG family ferredoxin protein